MNTQSPVLYLTRDIEDLNGNYYYIILVFIYHVATHYMWPGSKFLRNRCRWPSSGGRMWMLKC